MKKYHDIESNLNQVQKEVVFSNHPVILILAGPGSGKTRCLTYRTARLIRDGISPSRIMLTTFTNKATDEMKERLTSLVGDQVKHLWIGTFHSLGVRFLRRYCQLVNLTPNFTILDGTDNQELLRRAIANTGFLAKASVDTRKYFNRVRLNNILSLMRNTGLTTEEVLRSLYPEYVHVATDLDALYEEYSALKRGFHVCDFDDLLNLWLELLENHPEVADEIRNQFDHILVDEYQDINHVQSKIIDILAVGRNLAVVGDDQQSIYSFRGGDVDNILTFEKRYPDVYVIRLEDNYRSTRQIVAYANSSIVNNRKRIPKTIRDIGREGALPLWVEAFDAKSEARWVVDRIESLLGAGVKPEEIAVLYRSSFLGTLIEFECLDRKIRYQMHGGERILERPHIKDVVSWLRLFYNPKDQLAWKRVLLLQDGIGVATFEELWKQIQQDEDPVLSILIDQIKPSRQIAQWDTVKQVLSDLMSSGLKPSRMLRAVLTDSYVAGLEKRFDDARDRLEDLERLIRYAEDFDHISVFMERLALDESKTGDYDNNGVVLSTIHSAKGREYQIVFVVGCNEGYLPSNKNVERELEEERRLFYVACTRAKDQLVLTSYRYGNSKSGNYELKPSRFLREVDKSLYLIERL